jgi:benzodiazapine receptor
MTKNKYLSFFLILIITFIASGIGGFVTASFKEPWYSEIILPSFNPPSWVFAPVWTTLYILMAIAIWRVWIKSLNTEILKIYFYHLFFNAIWSIIFFGFHLPFFALIDLSIIILFVIYLAHAYKKFDQSSFYLTIPYILWILYAFVLNLSIVILNN